MRFLFLTTIYPAPGDSYMTGELAHELRGRGHEVEVLHIDWRAAPNGPIIERDDAGVRVVELPTKVISGLGTLFYRASKFVLTSRAAAKVLDRSFRLESFDAVVVWTPVLTVREPFLRACRKLVCARILFVYDFFPIHHMEIGMVPRGPVFEIAKRMEEALMRRFSTIICNLPANIAYLRRNYRLRPGQDVVSTPLWTTTAPPEPVDRATMRAQLGLPTDRPLALFGGQITDGRGIEQMLESAKAAARAGSDIGFLFVGNGRLAERVSAAASEQDNVFYLPGVSRDQYLPLVAACDVGMVATVPGVSSFSFPTKTMDYLRAGLPVVAAVEPGSDYLDILTNYDVGEGVEFGDAAGFFEALKRQAIRRDDQLATRAQRCLDEVFHVRHTANTVLAAVQRAEPLTG